MQGLYSKAMRFNFVYSYVCPECKSELEFKSMNKASDNVICQCGSYMHNVRLWAIRSEMLQNE